MAGALHLLAGALHLLAGAFSLRLGSVGDNYTELVSTLRFVLQYSRSSADLSTGPPGPFVCKLVDISIC